MTNAWGNIIYWTGLVLAAAFAGGAVIRVATDGSNLVETMMLAAASAVLAWLTGRGLRFVLTSKPRDVAPHSGRVSRSELS